MADAALLAEAYKRGLLPADRAALYEESVKRGLVDDGYAKGRLVGRGKAGTAGGIASTVEEAIPFMDEAGAGLAAVYDTAIGKGRGTGVIDRLGSNWKRERAWQEGIQDELKAEHPNVSALSTGVGYAAQAVPLLMTGGATAAPTVAARGATTSLAKRAAKVSMTGAKNATVGATYAGVNAAAGRGDAGERLKATSEAIPTGAVAGAVLPVVAGGVSMTARGGAKIASAVGRTGVRAANKIASKGPSGPFLDPQEQVLTRLSETLKADGLGPAEINAAMSEWQRVGGSSPAFMDIVAKNGGGQRTMALIRGAAVSGGGRNVASQYGNRVVSDLQDTAIERTRALTPDTRTAPAIEAAAASRIATSSAVPEVPAGSGGRQVHAALNQSYDEANAAVNEAYSAARAAAPEAAHLPTAELPQLSANLRESVRDFHPQDVPSVTRILDDIDRLSTPTMRDLFEARQHLSSLRASPDIQGRAAGSAVRALDTQIEQAAERGIITGDPAVVGQWRAAIAARRQFGRDFEGDDLIAQLTKRTNHGGARTTAVAPEDASNVALGRNGVAQRPDLVRDLTRLRDRLGADSPQWSAFRTEAASRVMGRDAGTENYGQALDQFRRQSPELANLLFTPEDLAGVATARQAIGGAVADREAVGVGRTVLNARPDEYAVSMTGVGERRPLAQVGARASMTDAIGAPAANATGTLNRLATGTNPGRNLRMTFGDEAANDYRAAIGNSVEKVQNARFINPNIGAQTAPLLSDEALVEAIPKGKISLVAAVLNRFRSGATLTDQERELLVRLVTTEAEAANDTVAPRLVAPARVSMTRPALAPAAAAQMPQENRR